MSVNSSPNADTSTDNANWGTIVLVLMVVVIGAFIAFAAMRPHNTPQAIIVTPGSSAPTVMPGPSEAPGAPGANEPSAGSSAGSKGSNPTPSSPGTGTAGKGGGQ